MSQKGLAETIRSEILAIRDTGATNMFDIARVKEIAEELDFNELVEYIDTNKKGYSHAIFTGEIEL